MNDYDCGNFKKNYLYYVYAQSYIIYKYNGHIIITIYHWRNLVKDLLLIIQITNLITITKLILKSILFPKNCRYN